MYSKTQNYYSVIICKLYLKRHFRNVRYRKVRQRTTRVDGRIISTWTLCVGMLYAEKFYH